MRLNIPRIHCSKLKTPAGWLVLLYLRHLPPAIVCSIVELTSTALRLLYWAPLNPLRSACKHISALSVSAGGTASTPRSVYRQFIDELTFVGKSYVHLFEEGSEAVRGLVADSSRLEADWRELAQRHGGLIVVVPHNASTGLAAVSFSNQLVTLVASTTYRSSRRHPLYAAFFQRVHVHPVHPVEEEERCRKTLQTGGIVIEALDKVHGGAGIEARIFGQVVRFPPWGPKWAAELGIPMLPCYPHVAGDRIEFVCGPLLAGSDSSSLTQDCVRFFETCIVAHPASWTFMLDRRWRHVVRKAVATQGRRP